MAALTPSLDASYSQVIRSAPPSTEAPLTTYPTQVAFSPDGSRVAGLDRAGYVCVASPEADGSIRCEENVQGCVGSTPSWSP
jgi:hypothetical protein